MNNANSKIPKVKSHLNCGTNYEEGKFFIEEKKGKKACSIKTLKKSKLKILDKALELFTQLKKEM
jgi:hypothetical protein